MCHSRVTSLNEAMTGSDANGVVLRVAAGRSLCASFGTTRTAFAFLDHSNSRYVMVNFVYLVPLHIVNCWHL